MSESCICDPWAADEECRLHGRYGALSVEVCAACDGAGGLAWDGPCTDCLGEGYIPIGSAR